MFFDILIFITQVSQAEGTVADLKKSIRKYITLKLKRSKKTKMRHKLISWKYIWKTYFLKHSDKILKDNNVKLKDIGIKNRSTLEFIKKKKHF